MTSIKSLVSILVALNWSDYAESAYETVVDS